MISKRIKTIAGLINPDENVLDVGTDHAFLPIQLKQNGHRGKIAATELRKGPRSNAIKNLAEAGIDDVEVFLTPGVRGIEFAADVVVIAGMGLTTVTGIISDDPEYFKDKRIIIQINHEMDRHSKYIYVYGIDSAFMTELDENGYPILDEDDDIYPLTLLIDDGMNDNTIRLAVPTSGDSEDMQPVTIGSPKFVYA